MGLRIANTEVKMGKVSSSADACVGTLHFEGTAVTLLPTDDDAGLLSLEVQFNSLVAELLAAQRASGELVICPDEGAPVEDGLQAGVDPAGEQDVKTKRVETILARLCPIEQAIMMTPARTVS
jgi:hypothetical protein